MITLKRRDKRRRGFTFVELLIIAVIIAIFASFSLPNFRRHFNGFQLKNFAWELQNFVNLLQERAINEGKIIYLVISSQENAYWAQEEGGLEPGKPYRFPASIVIQAQPETISFYPDGQADQAKIKLIHQDGQVIQLTTEGVFYGLKVLPAD